MEVVRGSDLTTEPKHLFDKRPPCRISPACSNARPIYHLGIAFRTVTVAPSYIEEGVFGPDRFPLETFGLKLSGSNALVDAPPGDVDDVAQPAGGL